MSRPRLFKYLRIAFSALCGFVCVLLVVFWVRSYFRWDMVAWGVTTQQGFILSSQSGGTVLQYSDVSEFPGTLVKWRVESLPSPDTDILPIAGIEEAYAGFLFVGGGHGFLFVLPYWFLVPLTAVFAALPWLRWRFSLLTLLIATTFIAVVLASIVHAMRN